MPQPPPATTDTALAVALAAPIRIRIPGHLAGRIDRLSRTAHRFHRWAHHPLCREYEGEVVALGTWRICRGCAAAAAGGIAGILAGLLLSPRPLFGVLALVLAALIVSPALAWPSWRAPKTLTRFLPATCMGVAILSGPWIAVASVLAVASAFMAYRRRGPSRGPCTICPERTQVEPCRGFARIARRERAMRRLAGRWLRQSGF